MVARKRRTPVVVDTNVFVSAFLARRRTSPNQRVIRLWLLEKRLQLVVSRELLEEYLEIFGAIVEMAPDVLSKWRQRFEKDRRSTVVSLGRRYTESRDPDDNLLLATARAGNAFYLITNDRDLLDLPVDFQRNLPFEIVSPRAFLAEFEGD